VGECCVDKSYVQYCCVHRCYVTACYSAVSEWQGVMFYCKCVVF